VKNQALNMSDKKEEPASNLPRKLLCI